MSTDRTDASNRRRELLKNYYGISNDAPATLSTPSNPIPFSSSSSSSLSSTQTISTSRKKSLCDVNDSNFNANIYLKKLLREKTLPELVEKEQEVEKSIRTLDSDMQMLVYENYNKFISATDTIRKMKSDFKKMEEQMTNLNLHMENITSGSSGINRALQDRRQQITQLSSVHTILKKLQFLFNLPSLLGDLINQEQYSQAVKYHLKAKTVLHEHKTTPSLRGIQEECDLIINNLADKLKNTFKQKEIDSSELVTCVELLMQLNYPSQELCQQFLEHAKFKIVENLKDLELQLNLWEKLSKNISKEKKNEISSSSSSSSLLFSTSQNNTMENNVDSVVNALDILEFVDLGCNSFLSNISLIIASYNELFFNRNKQNNIINEIATNNLEKFVSDLMEEYIKLIQKRISLEPETTDCENLVKALDKFHRRLQALQKLIPGLNFSKISLELIVKSGEEKVNVCFKILKQNFEDCINDIKTVLSSSSQSFSSLLQTASSSSSSSSSSSFLPSSPSSSSSLLSSKGGIVNDLSLKLHLVMFAEIKRCLIKLKYFLDPIFTFSNKEKILKYFSINFVRNFFVIGFLRYLIQSSLRFINQADDKSSIPASLLLIGCKLCLILNNQSIQTLLTLVEDQFGIKTINLKDSVSSSDLCIEAKEASQLLINHFVKKQAFNISNMLRKSLETRECINCNEPRNIKSVIKRIIEELSSIDQSINQLFEQGNKIERLSDSTTKKNLALRFYSTVSIVTAPAGNFNLSSHHDSSQSNWCYPQNSMETSLINNIQKLFFEKINIFSPVEFNKLSILTGIVKIFLKTFSECVRLKTFGKFGLQQIQVDCHYLNLYLWNYVNDENLVYMLLDEIMTSTLNRCLEPVAMEPSVVGLICERG